MEANKEEALKCLKIGKDAIVAGHRSRALKFLEKARRLDPSLPIDGLVSNLMKHSDESAAKESSEPSLRQRGSSSSSSSFTEEEQRAIVRDIKSKKDYYEILGLKNKNSSVEDIRKAYRKLSLRVHPDKNKAPGSEEAFKSVSKAYQCLSNEDTRRLYDITRGSSSDPEPVYQPHRSPRTYNNDKPRPSPRSNSNNNGFNEDDDKPRPSPRSNSNNNGFNEDDDDYAYDGFFYYEYESRVLEYIDFVLWLYRVCRRFLSFLRKIKR